MDKRASAGESSCDSTRGGGIGSAADGGGDSSGHCCSPRREGATSLTAASSVRDPVRLLAVRLIRTTTHTA